jgi:Ca-activated chloride channel family protein
VLLALALFVPRAVHADDGADGDRLFREGRYREAAAAYERAIRGGNDSPRLQYNLGTALLAAGRAEEAVAALERAAGMSRDLDIRYRALFNLGLVNLRQARAAKGPEAGPFYTAALDAYKRALRVQPDAFPAKWNYELALQMKHKGGGGGGGQGGGQPQPKNPDNGQPTPKPSGALDPRQAAQLLSSAAREERQVQAKKQQENQPERPPGGKDW